MPASLPHLYGHAGDRRRTRSPRPGHPGHPGAAAAALALSLGTHYIADRRVPGEGVLEKIATKTGKGGFYKLADFGINGAFHLDSAWHHGWETVAALIATTKATSR
ncbi:hypothetical protein ABZT06_46420 [Streptomyces sp. NPDC005483]|uniref:hypothetical protein n=1 Tax=Streptomyces sp. NPDC005483 TaxID=3154882 RepID=UPI00339ED74F